MNSLIYSCIKIFLCRILDVSFGTVRTMLTVKGKTLIASLTGFCEVFIWYIIVKDAITSDGPVIAIAISYALGYASGTFIGGYLSKALISGNINVQVITSKRDDALLQAIREQGYAITVIDANESEFSGKKYLIIASINKKKYKEYVTLIKSMDKDAFILANDTVSHEGGYFGK